MIGQELSEIHCKVIADMFKACNQFKVNADDLARLLLTSDYGISILTGGNTSEYADSNFMLEGFIVFAGVKRIKKPSYSEAELWFNGYLYKYWYDYYKTMP